MSTSDTKKPPARRRWLTFSLRAALLAVTGLCVWLGIVVDRAQRQERAVETLRANGLVFEFDRDWTNTLVVQAESAPHRWLRQALGDMYFRRVTAAGDYRGADYESDHQATEAAAHLAALPDLERVRLYGVVAFSDAGLLPLRVLRQLQSLDLTETRVDGSGLRGLQRLPHLTALHLGLSLISDQTVSAVRQFLHLQELTLNSTRLTDAGIRQLAGWTTLKSLSLYFTDVTDDSIDALSTFTALAELDIGETSITAAGRARLQQALPHCKITPSARGLASARKPVALWPADYRPNNREVREMVAALRGNAWPETRPQPRAPGEPPEPLPAVTTLDFDAPTITDEILLRLLAAEPDIQGLLLTQVRVGDASLAGLAGCKKLEKLQLCGRGFTDQGLAHLAELKTLRSLHLTNPGITDAAVPHLLALKDLPHLARLSLGVCQVSDEGLRKLQEALPRCRVVRSHW